MQRIVGDFFRYSFQSSARENRWEQVMQMIFKDYPAYLWQKPSLRRVLVFPFLLLATIFYGYKGK